MSKSGPEEATKNLYALVGFDELDKIVAETAWQMWKNYTVGITGQRIQNNNQKRKSFRVESVAEKKKDRKLIILSKSM